MVSDCSEFAWVDGIRPWDVTRRGEQIMVDGTCFIGIDVAEDQLDVAIRPTGERWQVPNEPSAWPDIVARVQALDPSLLVLEASGDLEAGLVAALALGEVPVAVANPHEVRDFAVATGRLGDSSTIDATILAHYAEAVHPPTRPMPMAQTEKLKSLATRRQQMLEMLTAERNRFASTHTPDARSHLMARIDWLRAQITTLDKDLDETVNSSDIWREYEELLRSVPGVGRVLARTLLAEVPELGMLDRKQIATLVGFTFVSGEHGTHREKRTIWGGRANVRGVLLSLLQFSRQSRYEASTETKVSNLVGALR